MAEEVPQKVNSFGEEDLDPRKTDNSPREDFGERYLTPEEVATELAKLEK